MQAGFDSAEITVEARVRTRVSQDGPRRRGKMPVFPV